jgi:hypothetical protein
MLFALDFCRRWHESQRYIRRATQQPLAGFLPAMILAAQFLLRRQSSESLAEYGWLRSFVAKSAPQDDNAF